MSRVELRSQLVQKAEQLAITPDDRRQTVAKFTELINQLINRMKDVDELFEETYTQIIYTGSYYEKLKINHADEFDLNLQIDLPFDEDECHVQHRGVPAGFAKFKLLRDLEDYDDLDTDLYSNIFQDDGRHLSRIEINRWMQSVVDKALANNFFSSQIRVKSHRAPATTLLMRLTRKIEVSVDLVPVIHLEHIPRSIRKEFQQLPVEERRSYLVPKPPPNFIKDDDALFRISLPELEKEQLQVSGNFKPVVRLFKSIRDENGWEKDFPSYLINTFFMWQTDKHTDDFWKNTSIENIFKKECRMFIETLESGELPHYYFPKFNLLQTVKQDIVDQMADKFREISRTASRRNVIDF